MAGEVDTNVLERPTLDVETPKASKRGLTRLGRNFVARIVRGEVAVSAPPGSDTATAEERRHFPRPPLYLTTFFLFVVLPTVANLIYLAFIASDQYVALSRFAVRTAVGEKQVELPAGSASASTSAGMTAVVGQDAYVIVTYIRSHAIIDDLSKTIDLRSIFRSSAADFWARLKQDATAEELLAYWNDMVTANVDGPSGIVTVRARAFTPGDAKALVEAIIKASEGLANDVSARSRADMVLRAENEVRRSEVGVRAALKDLQGFRESVGYIDPVATAAMTNKLLLQLFADKIKLENEYFVITRAASESTPSVQTLKNSIQSIDQQIEKLKASLAGSTEAGGSVAAALVRFETLELKRIFSEKLLLSAEDALERAKARADRQSIYVSVFVPAALPEEARYPERWAMSFIVPISLVVLWGIFALLVATIEDHRY